MDEVQEAAIVEANLESLADDATAEQILQATTGYSDAAVQIALKRTGGGGGAAGAATVIGPFVVEFDTPGLTSEPGAVLFPLTEGDWLLDAWVVVITEFDIADPLFLRAVGGPSPSDFMWNGWDLSVGTETLDETLEYNQATAVGDTQRFTLTRSENTQIRVTPARATTNCTINAIMWPSGPNPAEGEAHIWALTATPAA